MGNPNFLYRDACPACESTRLRTVYQCPFDENPIRDYLETFYSPQGGVEFEFLDGAIYFLYECEGCGLIFQREIAKNNVMERLYEKWIDAEKAFIHDHILRDLDYYSRNAQEIIQIIAYFRQKPSSLTFFDFGMGWGKWALMAKAFGCDAYGSELSKARIQFAKSNGVKVISWDEISQQQFDFINTEQVFEHISDPLGTLYWLKNALKPNGLLKIGVPSRQDIKRRLRIMDWKSPKGTRNSLNPVAPLEHINCFTRLSLLTMAKKAGMQEMFIPMKTLYAYTVGWGQMKKFPTNVLLPIRRNVFKKPNYILLRSI